MKTSSSGTRLPSRWPAWIMSPTLTRRLEKVPSTGARTKVKSRSRSALASNGLQFGKLRAGLVLLRLGHLDIVARGVEGGLRGFHRGGALVAARFGDFVGGARGKALGAQRLLALEIKPGALQRCFGGDELRLGLFDRAFLCRDLAADAVDGGLLGGDLGARGIHRDAIVAIVDAEDGLALCGP